MYRDHIDDITSLIQADWLIYAAINQATIGSNNGLSRVRRLAII